MPPAAIGIGLAGAALGGIAGAIPKKESQTSSVQLSDPTAFETLLQKNLQRNFQGLSDLTNAGPGAGDITAANDQARQFAQQLQSYAQSGGLPSQTDINSSNQIADQLFSARRVQQQQAFTDQNQRLAQLAVSLGRPVNDPILQAKLAQEQTRQASSLGAEQQGYATQLALNQPFQRLGFQQQALGVSQALASQALQNRAALLNSGLSLYQNQQNFRLSTATQNRTGESGGGVAGALGGIASGLGAGVGIGNQIQFGNQFQNFLQSRQSPITMSGPPSSFGGYGGYGGNAFG